jgi:putative radical SAM enzyme (TIGR03279 family)
LNNPEAVSHSQVPMPKSPKILPAMTGLLIEGVAAGSIAAEFELQAGDRLLAVNGHRLRDLIDYSYYTSSEQELLLEIARQDGETWELEVEREQGEPLGLTFAPPIPAGCRNNCIFCFVHQLPKGLRKPLYVKDEDYRLSFLNGNYVTLANLKPAELERIIEQRLSPLYISVHATNPGLRETMLGKRGIPPILEQLQALAAARITLHTQVVLCPRINDGQELERTVSDLAALYPSVQSLAIVPLGLTRHRQKLPQLRAVDREYAKAFITDWGPRTRALKKSLGEPFLFLADEFYLKAGLPFPSLREYGDLPQIENGVGLVPLFLRDAGRVVSRAKSMSPFRASIATGVSALGFVSDFLTRLSARTGLELVPVAIENRLFGPSVTVSGLVAGNDIIAALEGKEIGRTLLIPDVMLKEGEGVFLDDVSLEELGSKLGCRVETFDCTPQGMYRLLKNLE